MEPPAGLALLTLPRLALRLGPRTDRIPALHSSQPRQVAWRVLTEANTAASDRYLVLFFLQV